MGFAYTYKKEVEMARTLQINESEWVFLLAWTEIAEYVGLSPDVWPLVSEDIVWDHYITEDSEHIPGYCKMYQYMRRTITMASENRIPSVRVTAQMKGIKVFYPDPDPFDHSYWFADSVTVQIGTREPFNLFYADVNEIEPGVSWYPNKNELWDARNNEPCFP